MPYESYKNGGYKSLACGYGYTKSADGHCQPESWVFRLCQLMEASSLIYLFAVYFTGRGLLRHYNHQQYVRSVLVILRPSSHPFPSNSCNNDGYTVTKTDQYTVTLTKVDYLFLSNYTPHGYHRSRLRPYPPPSRCMRLTLRSSPASSK
jgi:hypothetical protein